MWSIHEDNKVVGFQHGLEKSSKWDANETPDFNSQYSVIDGCAVLMLDEVHSGSSDMELILARVLPKLRTVTNFKVMAEFLQRAKEAGLEERYVKTMDSEGRHQELINACLPPNTPAVRDNIELAVRAIVTLHHQYMGLPGSKVNYRRYHPGLCPEQAGNH